MYGRWRTGTHDLLAVRSAVSSPCGGPVRRMSPTARTAPRDSHAFDAHNWLDNNAPQDFVTMNLTSKAYFIGGGIGSLAASAFLIRDGGMAGARISVMEAGRVMVGRLDGSGNADRGHSMRGGKILTTDNYECTWCPRRSRTEPFEEALRSSCLAASDPNREANLRRTLRCW